jgi:glycosyltransferase involved in cell wall biosynthesis
MHIAIFTPGYGAEGAGAAGLRWHWLAKHLTRAGAEVTVFHNMQARSGNHSSGVREIYLRGPAAHTHQISYRVCAGIGHRLKLQARSPRLQKLGHYVASSALRYRHMPLEQQAEVAFAEVHARHPVSVAVGVCAPWSTAVAARRVAMKWRIPYLVEFQDPWKDFFEQGSWRLHDKTLKAITDKAAALINVCEHWCAQDSRDLNKPSLCVPNGFEPALFDVPVAAQPHHFRLAYVGTLGYLGTPYADMLWQGLAQIKHLDWTFDYAGRDVEMVRSAAERWDLGARIKVAPALPQAEALNLLKAADSLILFTHPTRDSHFGSKYAEYMACKRPIILVGRPDSFITEDANRLTRLIQCENADTLTQIIPALIEEKRAHGRVEWHGDIRGIAKLSWPHIADGLLVDLKRLIAQASPAQI